MPYTYLIGWSKHNKFYYGARWAANCSPNDLWTSYFTSSKHVKRYIEEYGNPDIIQVRKTFSDADRCKLHEVKVLKRLKVIQQDKWLNKNINGVFLPHGKQTDQHIKKRITRTVKTRKEKGNYHNTPETLEKIKHTKTVNGTTGKGIPKTPQHVANMICHTNNVTKIKCPHCKKTGQLTNMKRWHFDRCKNAPQPKLDLKKQVVCTQCGYESLQSPNFFRYHNKNCKASNPTIPRSTYQTV